MISYKRNLLNSLLTFYKILIEPTPRPKCWIFILGCNNSGTTLLESILKKNNAIRFLPEEGQRLTKQFNRPSKYKLSRIWTKKEFLFKTKKCTISTILKKEWAYHSININGEYFLEKSPTDLLRIKWYRKNFKPCKFISIVRNGYAVSEGIHRKTGVPLVECAEHWNKANQLLLNDFHTNPTDNILITYEDLTEKPDETLKKIYSHIGLAFDNSSLPKTTFKIHEYSSSIKNYNHDAIARLSKKEMISIV